MTVAIDSVEVVASIPSELRIRLTAEWPKGRIAGKEKYQIASREAVEVARKHYLQMVESGHPILNWDESQPSSERVDVAEGCTVWMRMASTTPTSYRQVGGLGCPSALRIAGYLTRGLSPVFETWRRVDRWIARHAPEWICVEVTNGPFKGDFVARPRS